MRPSRLPRKSNRRPPQDILTSTAPIEENAEQLAQQAREGCLVSFEKIIELHKDKLFGYLAQLVGNAHDAEDIAQEAFVKAYKNLHTFDGRARFSTWLFAIAKNTAFTHLRRRKAHLPVEELAEVLTAPAAAIDEDDRDSIWTHARALKPAFFELLWLFYGEGFSLKEVAEITKTNAITVRVNLHRARAALAKKCRIYEK